MTVRFDQPLWLLTLLVLLPMSVAAWRWFGAMGPVRRVVSILTRAALLAAVCAMLAGASNVRRSDKLAVVAVVDVSGSVRGFGPGAREGERRIDAAERARRWLLEGLEGRGPEDLLGVVVFDGRATAIAPASAGPVLERGLDAPGVDGTDIAQALRLGAGLIPPDAKGRLLLLSDGVQTSGDALAAAREVSGAAGGPGAARGAEGSAAAARRRVPIDTVAISYKVEREAMVEGVDAPARAPANAAVTVRVALRSTEATRGYLRLLDDQVELEVAAGGAAGAEAGKGVLIDVPAGRSVHALTVIPPPGRVHRFRAVFQPVAGANGTVADTIETNNVGEAFTVTPSAGRVLIVNGGGPGTSGGAGALWRLLNDERIEAVQVGPEGLPTTPLELEAFDLVVLQDVGAEAIAGAHQALVNYVTELGGGLVMLGGRDSFGAGGYKETALEPILPVLLDLPERIVVPTAAVVLVIDCSGSMQWDAGAGNKSRQEVANEGAAGAVKTLEKNDQIGVIAFNSTFDVVVPLGPNTDPEATAKAIRGIGPGGGTNLPPALEEAGRILSASTATVKHVIVLSDGVSMGRDRLPDMARRLGDAGIKVSTIAVGDPQSADYATMERVADGGRGEFFGVTDARVLPRVFIRAIQIQRVPMWRESPFVPVLTDRASPLIAGVEELGTPPPLLGLNLTTPRKDRTATVALASPEGEPLLAHWQAGVGQVGVFTSDAGEWGKQWLGWPGYRRMWLQVVRGLSRPGTERRSEMTTRIDGDVLTVRLELTDERGGPLDAAAVGGTVFAPGGERVEVSLAQVAPGVYEGTAPAAAAGVYSVVAGPRAGAAVGGGAVAGRAGRGLAPVVAGAVKPAGAEYRSLSSNEALLKEISAAGGGRVLSIDAALGTAEVAGPRLFDREGLPARETRTPLWPVLLPWAVLLFVVDVGSRRLAWDRLLWGRFGERFAARALRDRTDQAAQTVRQLRRREAVVEARAAESQGRALRGNDAAEVARAQRERRRAAKAAAAAGAGGGGGNEDAPARAELANAEPPPPLPKPVPGKAAKVENAETGAPGEADGDGLLAAKRRARKRFDS